MLGIIYTWIIYISTSSHILFDMLLL